MARTFTIVGIGAGAGVLLVYLGAVVYFLFTGTPGTEKTDRQAEQSFTKSLKIGLLFGAAVGGIQAGKRPLKQAGAKE